MNESDRTMLFLNLGILSGLLTKPDLVEYLKTAIAEDELMRDRLTMTAETLVKILPQKH